MVTADRELRRRLPERALIVGPGVAEPSPGTLERRTVGMPGDSPPARLWVRRARPDRSPLTVTPRIALA